MAHEWQGQEMLKLKPFQDWLTERRERYGGIGDLSEVVGIPERQLYTLITGFEMVSGKRRRDGKSCMRPKLSVSIDVVDRALIREGSTSLWELYPELYRWTPQQWDEYEAEMAALEALDRSRGIKVREAA